MVAITFIKTHGSWFQPIMLKVLLIMILSSAQRSYLLCSNYTHHHCNYATVYVSFIIFNDYISILRLQPVVFYIMLHCSAIIFYTLCSILCSWENVHLILHQVGMVTISQIKIVIQKVMIRMFTNRLIMTFNRLHWLSSCNFHSLIKSILLCWYYAWCFQQPIMLKIILA